MVARDRVERVGCPQGLAAVKVDRHTLGDRRQPRTELAARVDPSCRTPCLQERLLRGFLAEPPVVQDPVGNGVHEAAVDGVHGTNGFRIAIAKPCLDTSVNRGPPAKRNAVPGVPGNREKCVQVAPRQSVELQRAVGSRRLLEAGL